MNDARDAISLANHQAVILHQKGETSQAARAATRAYTLAREHLPPADPLRRRITMNAAALAELTADTDSALLLYGEARDVAEALVDDAIQGQALDRLFAIHRQREEYEDAVRAGEESLGLWRARGEPMNDQVLTFLNDLALVRYRVGDAERAAELLEEVIVHRGQHSTLGTPELALALLNLGTVRQSQGNHVAAESHFLSGLAIRRRLLPPHDPAIVDALQHLSELYAAQKEYRSALPYEEETLAAIRSHRAGPPELARAVNNFATTYYLAGELARSLPLYEEALALVEQDLGRQHPDTAVAIGNLANLRRQLGDFDGAERLLREVIATRRDSLGDLDPDVAVAIDDLTDVFRDRQSAPQAERLYGEVLQIVLGYVEDPDASLSRLLSSLERIDRIHAELAPDRHGSLARGEAQRLRAGSSLSLERVARLMFELREWALAATFFEEASAATAAQTAEWSRAIVGLAASLVQAQDLSRAEGVCDDFIATAQSGWAAPTGDYASVLHVKSQVQEITLGAEAAIPVMRESVGQSERESSVGNGGSLAGGLLRLAELSLTAGDIDAAAECANRVLPEAASSGGALTLARTRAVLANVARLEGRLVDAQSLFRVALPPMLAREPSWRTALMLRDFGLLYTGAANVASGAPLIQRAVDMSQDLYGRRSWQYATMLATLAEVRSGLGPVAEAAPLFVEVADIAEEIGVPQLQARALAGCGALYTRIGASQAAEGLLTRALSLMTRHQTSAGEIAGVETDLAMTEARLGRPGSALERMDRTITTLQTGAVGGARLTHALHARMWILGRMRRWVEAFAVAVDLADLLEEQLEQPLTMASSGGRDRFAAALYHQLDIMLSLALQLRTSAAIADAFDRTLRWKGAALTWSASQVHALAESTAVEVKALRNDFIRVRSDIIRQTIGGPATVNAGAMPIDELYRREEALDREIAGHLAGSTAARGLAGNPPRVSWGTVAAALPDGCALLEYVRYESIDFARGGPSDRLHGGTHRYAAFVLRPGAEPALHDIGDADAVDGSISRFRSTVTNEASPRPGRDFGGVLSQASPDAGEEPAPGADTRRAHPRDPSSAGAALRRLAIDPLLGDITACTRLHIAQHGEITRLPFAALPIDDGYLLDRYELAFLDSGRDLLDTNHRRTTPGPPLVIADPDFDLDLPSAPAGGRLQPFKPLSGTREEGKAVASLLGVVPRMGADAVESLIRSAGGPRILHIATHGFFLEDDRPPLPANLFSTMSFIEIPGHGMYAAQAFEQKREIDDGPMANRLTRIGRLPDPLMRSGVALAGSNTWVSSGTLSSGDDGLMTAAEIALLDFTSTDLAVLSACDTGLGEVRRGEGVFGLRRAFRIAGVSTLVMSLWKIPDAETRDLMIEFYRRSAAGEPVPQALRAAQLHVRENSPHPLAWAGLQCVGR